MHSFVVCSKRAADEHSLHPPGKKDERAHSLSENNEIIPTFTFTMLHRSSDPLSTSPLCPQLLQSHILHISKETSEDNYLCGQWLMLYLVVLISGSPWSEFSQLGQRDDSLEARAQGRAWGTAETSNTKETLIEREAPEPVINHNSTRTHCWRPGYRGSLS